MTLQVVGAGAGRTGTMSLKAGLELLLGRPCYHMLEVFSHPEHVGMWRAAAEGEKVDWQAMLQDYGATSDFPACLFWSEILEANPDAVVVLSTRKDAQTWWDSASQTIFAIDGSELPPEMKEWFDMWRAVATARRRTGPTRTRPSPPTSATTPTSGPRRRPIGSSNGNPVTDGNRCATPSGS